jgi:hypothetical protein
MAFREAAAYEPKGNVVVQPSVEVQEERRARLLFKREVIG